MTYAKELDTALAAIEKHVDSNDDAADLVDACLWPHSVFSRESLVGASERDFRDLSEYTKKDLKDAACGPSSKPVEDLHRNINVKARQNLNGNVSRHDRWHTTMTCPVLPDNGIKIPKATPEQARAAAATSLKKDSYKCNGKKFSMGDEIYKDLLTKNDLRVDTYSVYKRSTHKKTY